MAKVLDQYTGKTMDVADDQLGQYGLSSGASTPGAGAGIAVAPTA